MLWCDRVAPLGNPVVPDVYWMLIGSWGSRPRWARVSRSGLTASARDSRSAQESCPTTTTCSRAGHSAAGGLDHRDVVGGLERPGGDEHPDARLREHVGELVGAVRRVDVDEDRADLRGGELDEHPLGGVRRPDADPVALLERPRRGAPGRGGPPPPRARAYVIRTPWARSTSASRSAYRATAASRLSPMHCSSSGGSVTPTVCDSVGSGEVAIVRPSEQRCLACPANTRPGRPATSAGSSSPAEVASRGLSWR